MAEADDRNHHPHAPARVAMIVWGQKYAAQHGGSMDFWDTLSDAQKRQCRDLAQLIKKSPDET